MLTDEVDSVLTAHLRGVFVFDVALVSLGMAASILSALLLAAAMAAIQVHAAARAPIIRLTTTKAAPDLPLRTEHAWHMFLYAVPQTLTMARILTSWRPF